MKGKTSICLRCGKIANNFAKSRIMEKTSDPCKQLCQKKDKKAEVITHLLRAELTNAPSYYALSVQDWPSAGHYRSGTGRPRIQLIYTWNTVYFGNITWNYSNFLISGNTVNCSIEVHSRKLTQFILKLMVHILVELGKVPMYDVCI